jgi:hypothetical protein
LGTIEEGSYTKICVPNYQMIPLEAIKAGLTVDGLVYKIGDSF